MNRRNIGTARSALACAALLVVVSCSTLQSVLNREQIEIAFDEAQAEELELVQATIDDPRRVDAFVALLAERDALLDQYAVVVSGHRERLLRLDSDYSAGRQDFENLLDEFNRHRAAAQAELVELVYRMKQATTTEEWAAISAFQTEKVNLRRLAYQDRSAGD